MSQQRPLRGACSCGRNRYLILIPREVDANDHAEVYFDNSRDNHRSSAAPITAWLRVPLSWYQSHSLAYFPDETHTSIRKTFTPEDASHCKRVFCGICGTHLSYWSEQPPSEADFMSVSVASLVGEDVRELENLGLLHEEVGSGDLSSQHSQKSAMMPQQDGTINRRERHGTSDGLSWFEELIEGSKLGRTQMKRRGVGISADGTSTVEWEISEYSEGNSAAESATATSKRKIGEL